MGCEKESGVLFLYYAYIACCLFYHIITLGAGVDTVQFSFDPKDDIINDTTNGKDMVTGFDIAQDKLGVRDFLETSGTTNWTPTIGELAATGATDVKDNNIYNVTLDAAVGSMASADLVTALFGAGKTFNVAAQGVEALFMVKGSDGTTIAVFYDADSGGDGNTVVAADLFVGAALVGVDGTFTAANFV